MNTCIYVETCFPSPHLNFGMNSFGFAGIGTGLLFERPMSVMLGRPRERRIEKMFGCVKTWLICKPKKAKLSKILI